MRAVSGMTVIVDKNEVLKTLKENREKHKKIVIEARDGFIKAAKKELNDKLSKLEDGETIRLDSNLRRPSDFTNVYDVAITMFSLHQGDTMELNDNQVRCMVMDEWDWQQGFIANTERFSVAAGLYRAEKGW